MKIDIFDTDNKYDVIYADPPWEYRHTFGGLSSCGAVPYATLNQEELHKLPVNKLANKDCLLLLWVTMPMLQEGLDTIKAWGFKYKTCAFTWVKTNPKSGGIYSGLGHWTNGNAELCLLATKGHPKRVSKSVKQIVTYPRGKHSAKPPIVRDRIKSLMGDDLKYIELFARQETDGWDVFGDEV